MIPVIGTVFETRTTVASETYIFDENENATDRISMKDLPA